MRAFILFISIFTAFFSTETAWAQRDCFLANDGDRAKYSVMIDFAKAYISGVGIMARQENKIVCTVFNEFGVSILSFSYDTDKKRTKLRFCVNLGDRHVLAWLTNLSDNQHIN